MSTEDCLSILILNHILLLVASNITLTTPLNISKTHKYFWKKALKLETFTGTSKEDMFF